MYLLKRQADVSLPLSLSVRTGQMGPLDEVITRKRDAVEAPALSDWGNSLIERLRKFLIAENSVV